jgi:NarL family two-component system response regulator LiaR
VAGGSATVVAVTRLRVLLVDDQQMIAEAIAGGLAVCADLWVLGRCATDDARWADAVASLRPDVVVLHVACPAREVGQLVRRILTASPDALVVVLTPAPDTAMAVAVARAGALAMLGMDVTMERLVHVLEAVRSGHACYPPELLGTVLHELRADAERIRTEDGPLSTLSARECEVLLGMMAGNSGKQIARQMFLSANTVRSHSRSILMKLNVHSRLEAAAVARTAGWQCETLGGLASVLPYQKAAPGCRGHHTWRGDTSGKG